MKFFKRIEIFINKPKVFCIGMNKTGTTTMLKVFKKLNFRVAPQIKQALDIGEIKSINENLKIKKFCRRYNFFQDLPFSQGDYYKKINKIFPNSKYILTTRDSDKWFKSLCNFHLIYFRNMGFNFKDITEVKKEHLKKFDWIKEGYYYDYTKNFWISEIKDNQLIYNWNLLYNRDHYINIYEKRNKEIEDYFQNKKEDLLIFNVSENSNILKILNFLNMNKDLNFDLPHELKSNYDYS
jgi:hypothetical protein